MLSQTQKKHKGYYKVQRWQGRSFTWVDDQVTFETQAEAVEYAVDNGYTAYRVMHIHAKGRDVVATNPGNEHLITA